MKDETGDWGPKSCLEKIGWETQNLRKPIDKSDPDYKKNKLKFWEQTRAEARRASMGKILIASVVVAMTIVCMMIKKALCPMDLQYSF
jgi:hypothetical protein